MGRNNKTPIAKATWVSEPEFYEKFRQALGQLDLSEVRSVTGPGRSGAVAAVYASHLLTVPFIPFGHRDLPDCLTRILIVDTARHTGRTLRRALKKYKSLDPLAAWAFDESTGPRVRFWYEHWANPERGENV